MPMNLPSALAVVSAVAFSVSEPALTVAWSPMKARATESWPIVAVVLKIETLAIKPPATPSDAASASGVVGVASAVNVAVPPARSRPPWLPTKASVARWPSAVATRIDTLPRPRLPAKVSARA